MPETIPASELWDENRVQRYLKMYGDPREKRGSQSQLCMDASQHLKGDSVLDVACGIGHLVPFIGRRRYFGIDLSRNMLAKAQYFFPDREFMNGDATQFDMGCEFGTVVSVSLLLHLTDNQAEKALRCMLNHVAPGGRLVFGMETLGDSVQKRQSGLIIRNQSIERNRNSWQRRISFHHVNTLEYEYLHCGKSRECSLCFLKYLT